MTRAAEEGPSLRRAVILMTATSFLVPFAGLITAPVLAHALSPDGRGQLAAALAPTALMLAAATLGLPDALTFYLAKRPSASRKAIFWGTIITVVLGILCLGITWVALPFLSAGNAAAAHNILIATALTIPALVVGVFRGAANGRQMWRFVAFERLILTGLRVVCFVGLWIAGALTVYTAVLVSVLLPVIGGMVYLVLLARPPKDRDDPDVSDRVLNAIVGYGTKVWLGGIASMLINKITPLIMAPLSSERDLGLFAVATTVSDLPLIVALAVQGALFGVNARESNAERLTATGRLTALAAILGCCAIAVTVPFWISPLFGSEFRDATLPIIILLVSAIICVPGLMASSGLSAWGRPGLRSVGLALTFFISLASLVVLLPPLGVYGAAITSVIGNLVFTGSMVIFAGRVMGVPVSDFLVIRRADLIRAWSESARLGSAITRRFSRRSDTER